MRRKQRTNPEGRYSRIEFREALYRFMDQYEVSELDVLEAIADATSDEDLDTEIRQILRSQL